MVKRMKKTVAVFAVFIAAGAAYGIAAGWLGFGIPCPFRLVTGLKCPGCGVSRMFISLLRLDFKEAFYANRLLLVTLPVIVGLLLSYIIRYIRTGSKRTARAENIICIILIVLFLAFAVVRNIPGVNW